MTAWLVALVLGAAAEPTTIILDLEEDAASMLRARVRGQLTGSDLEVRFIDGACDEQNLCVQEREDSFLLHRGATAPRHFDGARSARAEMLAIALASALRAGQISSRATAPESPAPELSSSTSAAQVEEGRLRLGVGVQAASDGLGWHPRVSVDGAWGRTWALGLDLWLGGAERQPDPRLSVSALRAGAGLTASRRFAVGASRFELGLRAGLALLSRDTRAEEPGVNSMEGRTVASPAFGPSLAVRWRVARRWAFGLKARADVVPRIIEWTLDEGAERLQLDEAWPIHPVLGLELQWLP